MNAELGLEIPRPDIAHVLFTPNVPQTGAAVRDGGDWNYSLAMWRQLLTTTNAARGFSLQLPEALEQPTRGGPRKVTRD